MRTPLRTSARTARRRRSSSSLTPTCIGATRPRPAGRRTRLTPARSASRQAAEPALLPLRAESNATSVRRAGASPTSGPGTVFRRRGRDGDRGRDVRPEGAPTAVEDRDPDAVDHRPRHEECGAHAAVDTQLDAALLEAQPSLSERKPGLEDALFRAEQHAVPRDVVALSGQGREHGALLAEGHTVADALPQAPVGFGVDTDRGENVVPGDHGCSVPVAVRQ